MKMTERRQVSTDSEPKVKHGCTAGQKERST